MKHPIHRVTSFEFAGGFKLQICFDDGISQVIDFEPILKGELYGPLSDPSLFRQVKIDQEAHTLIWPNGADFDPATLHDWPAHKKAFEEMASHWESAVTDV